MTFCFPCSTPQNVYCLFENTFLSVIKIQFLKGAIINIVEDLMNQQTCFGPEGRAVVLKGILVLHIHYVGSNDYYACPYSF